MCTSITLYSLGLYLCGGIGKSWSNLLGKKNIVVCGFFYFFKGHFPNLFDGGRCIIVSNYNCAVSWK